ELTPFRWPLIGLKTNESFEARRISYHFGSHISPVANNNDARNFGAYSPRRFNDFFDRTACSGQILDEKNALAGDKFVITATDLEPPIAILVGIHAPHLAPIEHREMMRRPRR